MTLVALVSSFPSSLLKRDEGNGKWETEASTLRKADVDHRFFPYLEMEEDPAAESNAIEEPQRRFVRTPMEIRGWKWRQEGITI